MSGLAAGPTKVDRRGARLRAAATAVAVGALFGTVTATLAFAAIWAVAGLAGLSIALAEAIPIAAGLYRAGRGWAGHRVCLAG